MQKAFPIYAILLLLQAKLPAQVLPGSSNLKERYEAYRYGAGSSKCLMMDEFPEDQQACRQSYVYDDQQRLVEQHFQNKSKKRQVNRLSYLYDQQGRLLRMFEYYGEKQPVLEYRYRYE